MGWWNIFSNVKHCLDFFLCIFSCLKKPCFQQAASSSAVEGTKPARLYWDPAEGTSQPVIISKK